MTRQRQLIFWALAFALLIAFILVFKAVLLPFVLGIILAYFLNPVVNRLGGMGFPRANAAFFILSFFLAVMVLVGLAAAPMIYREVSELIANVPNYIERLKTLVENSAQRMQRMFGFSREASLETIIKENADTAAGLASGILLGLLHGGQAIINIVSLAVITPVVAYFIMKDWNKIIYRIRSLLPREHKGTIIELAREIDGKLSGFIRGQLSVAFILGVAYSIALSIVGLKYGFLIGILSGVLSIIPLVGSTVGFLLSITVGWFQTGDLSYVAIIAAIFIAGQLVEGNILTPRIVGNSVGLHPVWIFFALMAGASLAGILGMLVAVPIAAAVSVLCSFAVRLYKQSPYYFDEENTSDGG